MTKDRILSRDNKLSHIPFPKERSTAEKHLKQQQCQLALVMNNNK